MRAQCSGCLALGFGCSERDHVCTHRMCQLDAHVAQAADTDYSDLWPGPTFQWRSGDQVVMPAHSSGATAASCASEWRMRST